MKPGVRLADKLYSIGYPYDWDEELDIPDVESSLKTNGGEGKGSNNNKWLLLRDVVIFLEDCYLRTLPESNRQNLRTSNKQEFVQALSSYAHHISAPAITDALFPQLQLSRGRKIIEQIKNAADGGKVVDGGLAVALVAFVTILCDAAVNIKSSELGAEALQANHQRWQQDHPRRLVTSIDVLTNEGSAEGSQDVDPVEEEQKILALLRPIYEKRQTTMPGEIRTALQETAQFVSAVARFQKQNEEANSKMNNTNNTTAGSSSSTTAGGGISSSKSPLSKELLEESDALLDAVPLFSGKRTSCKTASADGDKKSNTPEVEFERACKVLRLLFMLDLRVLQDDINQAISSMQNYTATCKTDPKLGKVGR